MGTCCKTNLLLKPILNDTTSLPTFTIMPTHLTISVTGPATTDPFQPDSMACIATHSTIFTQVYFLFIFILFTNFLAV
jgi:hypothetical protein